MVAVSLYVLIAVVFAILLVAILVLGHDFDIGGDIDVGSDFGEFGGPGVSPLSIPVIFAFGASFGSFGAILEAFEVNPLYIPFFSAGASAFVAGAMYLVILRVFVRSQATTMVDPSSLVGKEAHVTIPIKAGLQGQILVITEERGRTLHSATSSEDIPRDAIVEIVSVGGGVASVKRKGA